MFHSWEHAAKNKNYQKVLIRGTVLDEFYAIVDENLSMEFEEELKLQRCILV